MFIVLLAWSLTSVARQTPWWFDAIAIPTWTLLLADIVIRSQQRMHAARAEQCA